jgi:polyphosphate kinase 2 (PPK2 family)
MGLGYDAGCGVHGDHRAAKQIADWRARAEAAEKALAEAEADHRKTMDLAAERLVLLDAALAKNTRLEESLAAEQVLVDGLNTKWEDEKAKVAAVIEQRDAAFAHASRVLKGLPK